MKATKLVLIVIFLACVWSLSLAYTLSDEANLHTAIFPSTYDQNVRPGADRATPLQLNVTFYFQSIKELDESISKFSITGALSVHWSDNRLTWNPSSYGGDLNVTIVPQKKVWVPFLINMLNYNSLQAIGHNDLNLRLDYTGSITWFVPNLFESTCDADLSFYPFDSQTCFLRFYVPGFMPSEIEFYSPNQRMDLSQYSTNGLWDVTETTVYTTTNSLQVQEVYMSISMRRRIVYYVSSLMLPVFFLSFLQLFSFLMPPDCGERVGFSITVLLAVAVYLTLIQDKLPEGSEPSVSYLSYKLLGDFMIAVFIVIGVIIGLRFYTRDDEIIIPSYLQRFHGIVLGGKCCHCRGKRKVSVDEKEVVENVKEDPVSKLLTWRDIGKATDRFCLLMFGMCLTMCNVVYMIVIGSFY
ncbi:neuronal acetylcholine receptor subunit alpha-3-like [Ostrea edulis]|uniref:neuronal acetylcholine receptor subunit alpha-3-like n=1 Tax=Ostrea edulis TaxID=37623 RepID=UPI0024AF0867|nr:neuronal acetylcholine receptor subunit alpha-3-like [Ostrea edulis]